MTSRQPGTAPPETTGPPGTTGPSETTGDQGSPDGSGMPGSGMPGSGMPGSGMPGSGGQAAPGPGWLVRVLPLTLLIILGLAGLRGAVAEARWDGPWQRDGRGL